MQSKRIGELDNNKIMKILTGKRDSEWTEETNEIIQKYKIQQEVTGN